jgi:hypothetical protein
MRILFTVLLFLSSSSIFSANIITPSSGLPLEINLIYKSLQQQNFTDLEYAELLSHTAILDTLTSQLDKEVVFFTIKSEIYKALLKLFPATRQSFDLDDAKALESSALKANVPFVKWIILSTSSDANNIFESSRYADYTSQKKLGTFLTAETKKMHKKIQLIAKMNAKINLKNPDSLSTELIPFYYECLRNIESALFLVASETNFNPSISFKKTTDPFKFFTVSELKTTPVLNKNSKTVEEILNDTAESLEEESVALPTAKEKLPAPALEEWTEEKSSPLDIKKLPKPSVDADWLQDF